jgi:hypothetical protein
MKRRSKVEQAAYRWWLSKRPCGWTEKKHLDHCYVNTLLVHEEQLAQAVADMCRPARTPER